MKWLADGAFARHEPAAEEPSAPLPQPSDPPAPEPQQDPS